MVGFLFDSELGQHGQLSILILNLGSMVGFLFYSSWAAWSAFYSELGQHGPLSIY